MTQLHMKHTNQLNSFILPIKYNLVFIIIIST